MPGRTSALVLERTNEGLTLLGPLARLGRRRRMLRLFDGRRLLLVLVRRVLPLGLVLRLRRFVAHGVRPLSVRVAMMMIRCGRQDVHSSGQEEVPKADSGRLRASGELEEREAFLHRPDAPAGIGSHPLDGLSDLVQRTDIA